MIVYAVVPLKDLSISKKRLSTVLSPQERKQLTLAMLEDVLIALQNSTVNKTIVISKDPTVRDFAGKFGAFCLSEITPGLNPAIEEATEWCMQKGAQAVLVLPADIPLLSAKDVDTIVELGNYKAQTVVLSRSFDGGTNALFLSPPSLIHASFGQNSFEKHFKEAQSRDICLRLYHSKGVELDIDSAEDLKKLLETENKTACQRFLGQINFGKHIKTDIQLSC